MYKKTEETYVLSNEDKLVMTFENGCLKVLINNEIKIVPSDIKVDVISQGVTYNDNRTITNITGLKVNCTVED